jgi:molybdenum cofactor cytidylyltransferase
MSGRSFAIVPGAGNSTRMGQPKLLMPIVGKPLVLHTLAAWQQGGVSRVTVVVRADDASLLELMRGEDVDVVVPQLAPADMKASIRYGIEHVAAKYQPVDDDCWLVAPADMPGLSPRIIGELLGVASQQPSQVLIPTLAGKRGHPVLLPWRFAAKVASLAAKEGLSSLIEQLEPALVACDALVACSELAFADIDTPGDVARFSKP